MADTYTIGQVAEITGISRDRLRYYEEKGILFPEQNQDNNYRNYTIADIYMILSIEYYRSMDLSMKDIRKVWKSGAPDDISAILEEKEMELSAKIKELQDYQENLRIGKEACRQVRENLNQFSIRAMPAFEVLGEISDFRAFTEYDEIRSRKEKLNGKPIVNSLKRRIIFSERGVEDTRMLITRDICSNTRDSATIMKYDRCLYTVVEDGVEKGDILENMFQKSLQWAKEHELEPLGLVIISMILITVDKDSVKSFLEIYAPIIR